MNKFRKPTAQHPEPAKNWPQREETSIWTNPEWRAETDDKWKAGVPTEERPWNEWRYDPATYAGPPAARGTVLQTLLGHGQLEYARPGHVEWDKPGHPRMVVKWRLHLR